MTNVPTIFFTGSGPGTGKTTVAGGCHRALEQRGTPVRCWYETEVLSQREFQLFFERFKAGDARMVDALKRAVDHHLIDPVARETALLTDSLLPFFRWLILGAVPAPEITGFCRWLEEQFVDRRPLLVVLRCPPEVGLDRVRRTRSEAWLEQWRQRESGYPLYRAREGISRWEVFEWERDYLDALGWQQLSIDAAATTALEATRQVLSAVAVSLDADALPVVVVDGDYVEVSGGPIGDIRIADGHVQLMGMSLPLVGHPEGDRARISGTNTTIQMVEGGMVLDSIRFGRCRYRAVRKEPGD